MAFGGGSEARLPYGNLSVGLPWESLSLSEASCILLGDGLVRTELAVEVSPSRLLGCTLELALDPLDDPRLRPYCLVNDLLGPWDESTLYLAGSLCISLVGLRCQLLSLPEGYVCLLKGDVYEGTYGSGLRPGRVCLVGLSRGPSVAGILVRYRGASGDSTLGCPLLRLLRGRRSGGGGRG